MIADTRFIERLAFFSGQRLFASDLQGIETFNREMRWLHNQSLHQPGIGRGFAVAGDKGAREVSIGAGYAIDALGREIVLTATFVMAVPPVASEQDGQSVFFDLTVAYPEDEDLPVVETRAGVCSPRGAVRLREEPVFCWARLKRDELGNLIVQSAVLKKQIETGMRLVLARAEVFECQLYHPLSIAQRRSARPATQPGIACASQKTGWQDWKTGSSEAVIGLFMDVDTSAAGFLTTPSYTARVDGPRVFSFMGGEGEVSAMAATLLSIQDTTVDGFRLFVLLTTSRLTESDGEHVPLLFPGPSLLGARPDAMTTAAAVDSTDRTQILEAAKKQWRVEWMGVEG